MPAASPLPWHVPRQAHSLSAAAAPRGEEERAGGGEEEEEQDSVRRRRRVGQCQKEKEELESVRRRRKRRRVSEGGGRGGQCQKEKEEEDSARRKRKRRKVSEGGRRGGECQKEGEEEMKVWRREQAPRPSLCSWYGHVFHWKDPRPSLNPAVGWTPCSITKGRHQCRFVALTNRGPFLQECGSSFLAKSYSVLTSRDPKPTNIASLGGLLPFTGKGRGQKGHLKYRPRFAANLWDNPGTVPG